MLLQPAVEQIDQNVYGVQLRTAEQDRGDQRQLGILRISME